MNIEQIDQLKDIMAKIQEANYLMKKYNSGSTSLTVTNAELVSLAEDLAEMHSKDLRNCVQKLTPDK